MRNTIRKAIQSKLHPGVEFKPSKEAYTRTGLNPKRFGMILDGKIEPTVSEARAICEFYGIELAEII